MAVGGIDAPGARSFSLVSVGPHVIHVIKSVCMIYRASSLHHQHKHCRP